MKRQPAQILVAVAVLAIAGFAGAQIGPGPGGHGYGPHMGKPMEGRGGPGGGRGMDRGGPGMGMGKWWNNSEMVKKILLTDSQVQKIEKIFQDHRTQLMHLHSVLSKHEAELEPLIEAERPDEAQVNVQIEKIAQTRANLEKSNAQMLLAIRRVLTVEQWKRLRLLGDKGPMAWGGPGGVVFSRSLATEFGR